MITEKRSEAFTWKRKWSESTISASVMSACASMNRKNSNSVIFPLPSLSNSSSAWFSA
jgi:hypothetical protein